MQQLPHAEKINLIESDCSSLLAADHKQTDLLRPPDCPLGLASFSNLSAHTKDLKVLNVDNQSFIRMGSSRGGDKCRIQMGNS
jgi:hypothetical protein